MLDQNKINLIKKDIDTKGFHCIENFITNEELNILRELVNQKLVENNYQYFFLTSEGGSNNLLNDEKFFENIENLLKKITTSFNYKIRDNEKLYKVLRVVTGEKSKKVSLDFHFDAHLLTLLIPIYIPNRKNSNNGNLIIIKNLRKLTSYLFKNIFQKIFFQSKFFKKFFIQKNLIKKEILNLYPGNVYIFNGFRTLHANMNIDPKDIRATILVHYYDIFKSSFLVDLNRKMRIKKELKNINSNKNQK